MKNDKFVNYIIIDDYPFSVRNDELKTIINSLYEKSICAVYFYFNASVTTPRTIYVKRVTTRQRKLGGEWYGRK